MDCRQVQEELLLSFGAASPEAELTKHLELCQECRTFWAELSRMAGRLPSGSAFEPTASERDDLLAAINENLASAPIPVVEPRRSWWSRTVGRVVPVPAPAVAAAAVLIVTASLFVAMNLTEVSEPTVLLMSDSTADSQTLAEQLIQPDQPTVEALMERYSSGRLSGAAEELLDDLTDDEYEYLVNHFDVGEIL